MLSIYVLDASAEARNKITNQISGFMRMVVSQHFILPRIDLKPIAIQELKFNASPDICIVGDSLVSSELSELSSIRKLLPNTVLIVRTAPTLESLEIFEQFARLGVDDTISENISADEFFKKILLLSGKKNKSSNGQLVLVDSSKGGQGVTSVVAAFGEMLAIEQKKVLIVDLDGETQDLSRFLQVKPFVNENLQALLAQQRPVSEESVQQCICQVWTDYENFSCMPAPLESDELYDSSSPVAKIFISILEVLDRLFDYVIFDIGSIKGSLQRTLYRTADLSICIVGNDPASLYSSANKIIRIKSQLSLSARMRVLESANTKNALPSTLVRSEISRIAQLQDNEWLPETIPYCQAASRWPGSGSTMYGIGSKAMQKMFIKNAQTLAMLEEGQVPADVNWKNVFSYISRRPRHLEDKNPQALISSPTKSIEAEKEKPLELPSPDFFVSAPAVKSIAKDNFQIPNNVSELQIEISELVSEARVA